MYMHCISDVIQIFKQFIQRKQVHLNCKLSYRQLLKFHSCFVIKDENMVDQCQYCQMTHDITGNETLDTCIDYDLSFYTKLCNSNAHKI